MSCSLLWAMGNVFSGWTSYYTNISDFVHMQTYVKRFFFPGQWSCYAKRGEEVINNSLEWKNLANVLVPGLAFAKHNFACIMHLKAILSLVNTYNILPGIVLRLNSKFRNVCDLSVSIKVLKCYLKNSRYQCIVIVEFFLNKALFSVSIILFIWKFPVYIPKYFYNNIVKIFESIQYRPFSKSHLIQLSYSILFRLSHYIQL